VPRAAKGGIRSQSKRGSFGENWWAKRWIAVLEGFNIGSRLQRGRSYARSGQVVSLDIKEGRIEAAVQGSRPIPYEVEITVKTLPQKSWAGVAGQVSKQAAFASKLLGGTMPNEMEEVFRGAGVSLFPERYNDLKTDCTCPDSSNPCKHIAAVFYLLGEEFDRDPFLIFKMRGMSREEFLALLGEGAAAVEVEATEPLPADPAVFWKLGEIPDAVAGEPAPAARRLGKFPLWRGSEDFLTFLDRVYAALSVERSQSELVAAQEPEHLSKGVGKVARRSVP
jgi:uncharacterized Zn finger protein